MTSSAKDDADQHRLAARFVDGPYVSAPDKAEQRLRDWLTDLAVEQAAAIDVLIGRFPRAKTILLGIAEASPYLFDLLRADILRGLDLRCFRVDKNTDVNSGLAQLVYRRAADRDIRNNIKAAFGCNFIRAFGDERDGIGKYFGGYLNHLFRCGHLNVQISGHAFF